MNITTKNLRKEPGKVLKKVANGQPVFVTYRGKKIAKLVNLATENAFEKNLPVDGTDDIFGLWKNYDHELSVDETVRAMREGRKF
jgi:prevent-host-death family protein